MWKWETVDSDKARIGAEFSKSITSIAHGDIDDEFPTPYSPTKKIFFEESRFNPGLDYPNNNSAYDSHYAMTDKQWHQTGNSFTRSNKFSRDFEPPGGPTRPDSVEHVISRPEKVFGRNREINSLYKAKVNTRPKTRIVSEKIAEKDSSSPNPMTYHLPDPWIEASKEICGSIRPSSVFASTSHRFEDSTLNQQSSHISSFLDFSVSSFRSVPSISKDSFLPITAKPVERHGKYSTCFVGGYLDQISTMETDKSLNFSERSHPESSLDLYQPSNNRRPLSVMGTHVSTPLGTTSISSGTQLACQPSPSSLSPIRQPLPSVEYGQKPQKTDLWKVPRPQTMSNRRKTFEKLSSSIALKERSLSRMSLDGHMATSLAEKVPVAHASVVSSTDSLVHSSLRRPKTSLSSSIDAPNLQERSSDILEMISK